MHVKGPGFDPRHLHVCFACPDYAVGETDNRPFIEIEIDIISSHKTCGSGGIRTHASEETGALNQRLRPLGHATRLSEGGLRIFWLLTNMTKLANALQVWTSVKKNA